MELYLSSYRLGGRRDFLEEWIRDQGNKILVITNAMDAYKDENVKNTKIAEKIYDLVSVGFQVNMLDLREYFGKKKELKRELDKYRAFFVLGGNVFVLRQAMKLSGFDKYLKKIYNLPNYLYAGYSAGICVLGPTLDGLDIVDDKKADPYNRGKIIWDGLGLINYVPVPHYDSPQHIESHYMLGVVNYLKSKKRKFKTLKDGDVIIISNYKKIH